MVVVISPLNRGGVVGVVEMVCGNGGYSCLVAPIAGSLTALSWRSAMK